MLKKFRRNHAANGRRALEAVTLVLHTVEGYLTGKPADVASFENPKNVELRDALLYAFDPFANDEFREIISQEMGKDLTDKSFLEDYYRDPVLCIMRIRDSIDLWTKEMGRDGYFGFIEGQRLRIPRRVPLCLDLPLSANRLSPSVAQPEARP